MASANSSSDSQLRAMQKLAQLAIEGDYDQVRQLATADLVKARDEGGRTVLMLAADADWTPQPFSKCIKYFLHLGADAKAAELAGNTAAHVAAGRNHVRLLALLPFEAKWLANKEGVTPLMEAVQKGSLLCAKHLLHLFRQGRYFFKHKKSELLGMKNRQGQTALDIARASDQADIVSIFQLEMRLVVTEEEGKPLTWKISGLSPSEAAAQEELERLVSAGDLEGLERCATSVTCDLPDAGGLTPLMLAAREESGRDEAVQLLIRLGGDATCAAVRGYSCLHWAAEGGRAVAVGDLLAAGAHVDDRDAVFDRTPLMCAACSAPHVTAAACVQALLSAGAEWSLRDSRGRTALDWAKILGRSDLAALLNLYGSKSYFDEPLELTESDKRKLAQLKREEDEQRRKREKDEQRRMREKDEQRRMREKDEQRRKPNVVEVRKTPPSRAASVLDPSFTEWEFMPGRDGKKQLLGAGGFGKVFRVFTDRQQTVAVKIVKITNASDAKVQQMIKNEENGIKILEKINHPNIMTFLKSELTANKFYIFTELISGNSLYEIMNGLRKKPFDETAVRNFTEQICSALNYLHCKNILHRDIKCQNIMLTNEGVIKLIDFGFAKQIFSTIEKSTKQLCGTWYYMAPELFGEDGRVIYTAKTDVWALGCTMFEMVTMQPPNAELEVHQIPMRIWRRDLPDLPPEVSADLRNFYRRCVVREPGERADTEELMRHRFLK